MLYAPGMSSTRTQTAAATATSRGGTSRGGWSAFVRRADGRVEVVELVEGKATTFGRDGTDVVLQESQVSRKHASLEPRGALVVVTDLGSRNGTLVAGRRVRDDSAVAGPGDVVRVGGVDVVLARTPGASVAATPGAAMQPDVVVADPAMGAAFELARRAARSEASVLLLGETGVGKEVFARHVHAWSPRADGPFVAISCAAIPDTLVESELFGHERGAFTGAERRKLGCFEAAKGGTLFLDEVGELAPSAQAKLLRVLETKRVQRLGGTAEVPADARVVFATHRDLAREVDAGRFRHDLFFRVSAVTVRIPPLRERRSEIAPLAHHFARALSKGAAGALGADVIRALEAHAWPGNVRELRNAIEHALVVSGGAPIALEHLPDAARGLPSAPPRAEGVREELADLERRRIEQALERAGGNQTKAAELLGMPRRTLVYKLSRWRKKP